MKAKHHPKNFLFAGGVVLGIGLGMFATLITVYAPTWMNIPGNISLHVQGVREDASGGGPLVPLPGYHFVIVDLSLQNNLSFPITIAPLLNFYLKDSQGLVYAEAAVPTNTQMHSGTLLQHDSLREEVGFMVKNGAIGLRLYYEPGISGQPIQVEDLDMLSLSHGV